MVHQILSPQAWQSANATTALVDEEATPGRGAGSRARSSLGLPPGRQAQAQTVLALGGEIWLDHLVSLVIAITLWIPRLAGLTHQVC